MQKKPISAERFQLNCAKKNRYVLFLTQLWIKYDTQYGHLTGSFYVTGVLTCQTSEQVTIFITKSCLETAFFVLLVPAKNWHELCISIIKEEEMIALTRNEIADELTKLGIVSPVEIQAFSMEYMIYYKVKCLKLN